MKAVLIMGSTFDEPHAKKITDKLDEFGISWEQFAFCMHRVKPTTRGERRCLHYYCR